MGQNFEAASRVERREAGVYRASTDASWQQGRGVFGGLLLALVAGASESEGPGHRLRSLSMEFIAPVKPGELQILVQPERSGVLVARQSIRMLQEGLLVGLASVVLARDRPIFADFQAARMPQTLRAAQVSPLPFVSPMPAFTQHFQYRPCLGATPASGADSTEAGGWIAAHELTGSGDTVLMAALLDSWFPAWLGRLDRLVNMASVCLHAHFHAPWGPAPGSSPVLVQNRTDIASGGYATEENQLWAADGRLLARSQQLVALLEG